MNEAPNPVVVLRHELTSMEGQFKAALPAHIPAERFMRVLMTAIQNNPKLLTVDRRSLWNSAMKAAQDGLLPDGREGAIVEFKNKGGLPVAQWMPMIAGLRKKVRNSGEIATWDAQVVHQKDKFHYRLGDDPLIEHEPSLEANPGPVIAAYSVATLKSGEKSREVMSVAQIEQVRKRSRAKDGPWFTDYDEMCRKTVAKRHSKALPMSTDLDDLLRRDDDLYDLKGAGDNAAAKGTISDRLSALAAAVTTETAPALDVEAEAAATGADTLPACEASPDHCYLKGAAPVTVEGVPICSACQRDVADLGAVKAGVPT
jgi:recombination protein RecT